MNHKQQEVTYTNTTPYIVSMMLYSNIYMVILVQDAVILIHAFKKTTSSKIDHNIRKSNQAAISMQVCSVHRTGVAGPKKLEYKSLTSEIRPLEKKLCAVRHHSKSKFPFHPVACAKAAALII